MRNAIAHTWNDRTIRIATLTVICVGFTYASTVPYYSLIGVEQLGMTPLHYAMLAGVAAAMSMVGSVVMGVLADQSPNRKRGVMLSLSIGLFGFSAFYLFPNVWTFMAFMLLITPVSSAAYTQLFAIIRSVANSRAPAEAIQINSTARAVFALSWVVVPGIVGTYVAARNNVSDGFAIAVLAFIASLMLYGLFGAPGGRAEPVAVNARQSLLHAFGLLTSKHIALRIAALAMIASAQPANLQLLPLMIMKMPGGGTQSIGIVAGLTAALEVPLMLIGGYFASRLPLWKLIIAGGIFHAAYLGLLGHAQSMTQIYALTLINALGNAIMLTLHLSYFQDLLPDRPGLGTSLLSIAGLVCKIIAAIVFAMAGTALGFSGAALCGAAISLAGCVMLLMLDGQKKKPA